MENLSNHNYAHKIQILISITAKIENIENEQKSNASDILLLHAFFGAKTQKIDIFFWLPDIEMLFLKDEIDMLIQSMTS